MKTKIMIALLAALTLCGCTAAPQPGTPQTADDSSAAETTAAPEESDEASEESAEETSGEEVKEPPSRDVGAVDPNAITFDSGEMYSGHQMGEGGDEADIELSVVDYEGDKKLKVHVLRDDPSSDFGVPKIVFNLPKMIDKARIGDIAHISVDFTCVGNELWKNDDGSEAVVVGNFLGALAGNLASEKGKDADGNITQNTWATHFEFKHEDWEFPEHTWRIETDVPGNKIPANGYAANDDGTTLVIMRWPQKNDADFYIDNITFFDKEGKSIPIIFDAEDGAEAAPADDASSETDAE